jgi:arylsulfatase A-like enzyme
MSNVESPNIIIIIADSLRADFLTCYGGRVETPNLDQLAKSGTKFDKAYSQGPQSAVSHASMFTGKYPSNIGVVRSPNSMNDTSCPTIAEWLKKHGYKTYGIAGPGKMSSDYGYDRGFEEYYETYYDAPSYLSKEYIQEIITQPERKELAKQWIRTATRGPDRRTGVKFDYLRRELNQSDRPFFGVMNTTVTHYQYNAPRPYKSQECPEIERSKFEFIDYLKHKYKDFNIWSHRVNNPEVRDDRIQEFSTLESRAKYASDPSWLNDQELSVLRDWYAATIRYFDEKLGEFLEQIADSENTVVIITADHGEHFGEHGVIHHGWSWFDECHRVPLVFSELTSESDSSEQYASLVDLFPTICDITDTPTPENVDGESLLTSNRQYAISEVGPVTKRGKELLDDEKKNKFDIGRKYIRNDDWLFVAQSDGIEEWYKRPSEEKVDITGDKKLKQRLLSATPDFTPMTSTKKDSIPDKLESNLKDLGYI